MKFEKILPAFRKGKKIRSVSYSPKECFQLRGDEFYVYGGGKGKKLSCIISCLGVAHDFFKVDDWEIVE